MKLRSSGTPKSAATRKTPPGRKPACKAPTDPTAAAMETKRSSAAKAEQEKNNQTSPSKPALLADRAEEVKPLADAAVMLPDTKVESANKSMAKRKYGSLQTPAAAKAKVSPNKTSKSAESVKGMAEESTKSPEVEDAEDLGSRKKEEVATINAEESANKARMMEVEETVFDNVGQAAKNKISKDKETVGNDGEFTMVKKSTTEERVPVNENLGSSMEQEESFVSEAVKSSRNEAHGSEKEREELQGGLYYQMKYFDNKKDQIEHAFAEEKIGAESQVEAPQAQQDAYGKFDEGLDEYGDRVDFGEHDDEDLADDDDDDEEDPAEETETLEEERRELTAVAKQRRIKKEHEIFVGGLDRNAVEEDLRKAFEKIGEVVEVRLHRDQATMRSKGYAFVKFANKEHVKRALSEMKNPVICGKRCGTAPSEDNDTLFLGNICNTWTKEAIKQKLKDYGIKGLENITLVPDLQHEGLSRGFAFLEFSCHVDAMFAYKRLQKPDVVFGHLERTAKVAFSEPLREPDPEIMANVKTVFLDLLPPQWDEDHVREKLKGYGEIVRVVLARNMSTAKRKDFGFVDFSTHEAAIACINGVNDKELVDGKSKTRVRARLSNPLPKAQAIRGGMCGGFRIGHGSGRTFTRFGKGFARGGHHFDRPKFQHGRGFYHCDHGQSSRTRLNNYNSDNRFQGRQIMRQGGRRGPFRGGSHAARGVVAAGSSRHNFNRSWLAAPERSWGENIPFRRQPFSPEPAYDRPYFRRNYDDPYSYYEAAYGIKRPFYMTEHEPDYVEHSRHRPRLDYTYPEASFREPHYDMYGGHGGFYSHDYHFSDYAAYPPSYGADRSYGGGYY